MSLINEDQERMTPKQIAKRVATMMLNIVNIDNEIQDFADLTEKERASIHDQYSKLIDRIQNKYL